MIALFFCLLGVLVGGLVGWLLGRGRPSSQAVEQKESALSDQLLAGIDLLRSPALIADAGDRVLHSTPAASTSGLVRGNRIGDQEMLDLVRRVRDEDNPLATQLVIKRERGRIIREFSVRAAPIPPGLVMVIADDRSAETRTDEIKRDFTANVSHELKTPVGALRVLAEALVAACDDPAAVKHFASRMIETTERLSELISQIIELSRLQSADPMLAAEVVKIDDVTKVSLNRCQALAASREVHLSQAGRRGLEVLGDKEQLVSALTNLIQNAINYSDNGSRVAVSTRLVRDEQDEFVEISVADNGWGISQSNLERIFERFYRVDYARSRETGGTGLGLSIVKHVMNAHQGTVNVWSKIGQGSTFTMRMPKFIEPETDASAPGDFSFDGEQEEQ